MHRSCLSDVIIRVYDENLNIYELSISLSTTQYGYFVEFYSVQAGTYYVWLYDGIQTRIFRILKEDEM